MIRSIRTLRPECVLTTTLTFRVVTLSPKTKMTFVKQLQEKTPIDPLSRGNDLRVMNYRKETESPIHLVTSDVKYCVLTHI